MPESHEQQKLLRRKVSWSRILFPVHPFPPMQNGLSSVAWQTCLRSLLKLVLFSRSLSKPYNWNHTPSLFHWSPPRQRLTLHRDGCDDHGRCRSQLLHRNQILLYRRIPILHAISALAGDHFHSRDHLQNGCKHTSLLPLFLLSPMLRRVADKFHTNHVALYSPH